MKSKILSKSELVVLQRAARKELARRKLLEFTDYTNKKYEVNWHHKSYAEKLDSFSKCEIKNLMIFMPPQHGKSELSSRRLPAFMLGKNPNLKIGIIAYNHTIASKFNRDVQRIIDTREYADLFPSTSLNENNVRTVTGSYLRNSDEFEIVGYRGSLVSVGVGGGLTSRSIDLLIMDDLYKDAQDAWSDTVRSNVQDWYYTVAKTRLHNNSQQLLVFTRWHEEDLAGHLLSTEPEKWEVLIFPAIKEGDPNDVDPRKNGEALWASKHSLEKLLDVKKINPIVFDSLYQQNPTPKEGLLLPVSELKRFRKDFISNTTPDAVISACDIADEGDDNLCHPIGYIYGKEIYIVDVNFTQQPIEITQSLVAAALDRHRVNKSVFESNNGGKGYAQQVNRIKNGMTTVTWKPTSQNKHTRILMKSGMIKEHCHFLIDEDQSDEYKRYFRELTHYPKNGKVKHDDAADGTTMLIEMLEAKPKARAGIVRII